MIRETEMGINTGWEAERTGRDEHPENPVSEKEINSTTHETKLGETQPTGP